MYPRAERRGSRGVHELPLTKQSSGVERTSTRTGERCAVDFVHPSQVRRHFRIIGLDAIRCFKIRIVSVRKQLERFLRKLIFSEGQDEFGPQLFHFSALNVLGVNYPFDVTEFIRKSLRVIQRYDP